MVHFIAGEKGAGKTKKLLGMTNDCADKSNGNVVFIKEDNNRHMHELKQSIRFVETKGYELDSYKEFIGFVSGIMVQDNDITDIFVDGLIKIIGDIGSEDLIELTKKLEYLSKQNDVNFTISMNYVVDKLPEQVKALLI